MVPAKFPVSCHTIPVRQNKIPCIWQRENALNTCRAVLRHQNSWSQRLVFHKFPVFFPVKRKVLAETALHRTAPTTIPASLGRLSLDRASPAIGHQRLLRPWFSPPSEGPMGSRAQQQESHPASPPVTPREAAGYTAQMLASLRRIVHALIVTMCSCPSSVIVSFSRD